MNKNQHQRQGISTSIVPSTVSSVVLTDFDCQYFFRMLTMSPRIAPGGTRYTRQENYWPKIWSIIQHCFVVIDRGNAPKVFTSKSLLFVVVAAAVVPILGLRKCQTDQQNFLLLITSQLSTPIFVQHVVNVSTAVQKIKPKGWSFLQQNKAVFINI